MHHGHHLVKCQTSLQLVDQRSVRLYLIVELVLQMRIHGLWIGGFGCPLLGRFVGHFQLLKGCDALCLLLLFQLNGGHHLGTFQILQLQQIAIQRLDQ